MTCLRCGTALTGRQQKWCSEDCRKREWDETVYRHTCSDCGVEIGRRSERCHECRMARSDRLRIDRWTRIASLWAAGVSMKDIAPQVGRANANALGVEMDRMKKAGWDLPYRRAGWTGHYRKTGPPTRKPRTHAHVAMRLAHAVRSGRLIRPDRCERCGVEGYVDGHHADYSKPLEVEWLCRPCHIAHHAQEKTAA